MFSGVCICVRVLMHAFHVCLCVCGSLYDMAQTGRMI